MWGRLPKRKRLIVLTAAAGVCFVVAVVAGVVISSEGSGTYVPGSAIEGLTNDLDRDLPSDYPRVTFTEVSEEVGIRFRHFRGTRSSQLPEDMGSGAAWGDFDADRRTWAPGPRGATSTRTATWISTWSIRRDRFL